MQQGGHKNNPWSTYASGQGSQMIDQNTMGLLSQFQQSQQMFQSNLMKSQPNIGAYNLPSMVQQAGILNQPFQQPPVVAYPTPRALNASAYQNTANQSQNDAGQMNNRVFRGKITKLHHKYGFIDENVFFQMSVVKGPMPSIGDTVLVEATYSPAMPFKWNAKWIEVVAGNVRNDSIGGGYNNNPIPMDEGTDDFDMSNAYNRGCGRNDERDRPRYREELDDRKQWKNNSVEQRKDDRDKIVDIRQSHSPIRPRRNPVRPRSPSHEPKRLRKSSKDRSQEQSTERSRDQQSKKTRRYAVQVPKVTLDISYLDVYTSRQRYGNMYVPSDFFHSELKWVEAFPPEATFSLQNKTCSFHIMPKEADSPFENSAVFDPPDSNYSFSAKVMLLSMPSLEEIYQKCCGFASESNKNQETHFVHPTRLIRFLVGVKGKNETMAIGGPWSPSLDGPNPDKDPSVLIKTAIRTCKALTGIDLSKCTQWYRFTEVYYRRQAGGSVAADAAGAAVETVVIFVPGVWSCQPTRVEWESLQPKYRELASTKSATSDHQQETAFSNQVNILKHYSKLDPSSMTLVELTQQLIARNINAKGFKQRLIKRLQKCLDEEKQLEDTGESSVAIDDNENTSDDVVILIDEDNESDNGAGKSEKDKRKQSKAAMYTLPEQPHIIVHPSRTARSGKYDCAVISLSVLLDYRPDDAKEHAFEVSLFAEVFNEMLIRDFGLNIYKALISLPDKPKDDEKKKESGDKKKDSSVEDKNNKSKKENEKDSWKTKADKYDKSSKSGSFDKDDQKKKEERVMDREKHKRDEVEEYNEPVERSQCDAHLLLSFIYFDTNHCWRIQERDAEQLLLMMGLKLSRAHVKKTINKALAHGIDSGVPSIYYRQLIMKPDAVANSIASGDSGVIPDMSRIGNRKILPVFQDLCDSIEDDTDEPVRKRGKINGDSKKTEVNKGLVWHIGGWVDLDNLMSQLNRSECSKAEIEEKMGDLKAENKKIADKNEQANKLVNNLTNLSNDLKKKVKEKEKEIENTLNEVRLLKRNMKQIQKLSSEFLAEATTEEKANTEHSGKQKSETRWSKDDGKKEAKIEDNTAADNSKIDLTKTEEGS